MSALKEGAKAPAFALKDKDGKLHRLRQIEAEYVIVYFYPRDNTPGCTLEAQGFTRERGKFEKLGATVVGISGGDEASKQKFCSKHKLRILLLSDPEFKTALQYGAYGEKQFMGKKSIGILRKTFVLDGQQRIIKIYHSVKAAEHPQEVREYIRSLSKE